MTKACGEKEEDGVKESVAGKSESSESSEDGRCRPKSVAKDVAHTDSPAAPPDLEVGLKDPPDASKGKKPAPSRSPCSGKECICSYN